MRNKYHIKSVKKGNIQTSWGDKNLVLKNPNVSREERIRQLRDIKRRKDYFKSRGITGRKFTLSREKYTTAKGEEESPGNIATVQSTVNAAQGVMQTGGVIRTAVSGTRTTAGRIQTAVNRGVSVGSVKDVGRMAGSAWAAAKNATVGAVKEAGHSLLKTKIDKTTTTDTGAEAIKQGLTEVRYADNARKVVHNTAQGSIKTARSIRETPKSVGHDVQRIRENIIRRHRAKQAVKAKKTGKAAGQAAKKGVSFVGKVVKSKGFIIIALGAGLVLLVVVLLTSFISMILSAISSMFSWLIPGDGSVNSYQYLQQYYTRVQTLEETIQEGIDDDYEYTPEYRYDDTEITSLNQYGNLTLDVDMNAVIAAAAVKRFEVGDDMLTDDDLAEMIEYFYSYDHHIDTGYCPDADCMKDENVELTIADGDFSIASTNYVPSTNEYAVTFKGTCYEHTSSVWTDLTIATSDGSITGSAYANIYGSSWEITYNIGAAGYSTIDWDDITIKTTTIYCDNPNHNIYYGEVVNIDAETGLAEIGFTEDMEGMFWTYYGCLQQGGL